MKNVTITLPEPVARWARVWAARHNTSVSRMLGDLLTRMMEQEGGYEKARRSYLGRKPRRLGGNLPDRDALHDRTRLR